MDHCHHIGSDLVNLAVDEALRVAGILSVRNRFTVQIVIRNISSRYNGGRETACKKKVLGVALIAHADVAVGIDYAFVCQYDWRVPVLRSDAKRFGPPKKTTPTAPPARIRSNMRALSLGVLLMDSRSLYDRMQALPNKWGTEHKRHKKEHKRHSAAKPQEN